MADTFDYKDFYDQVTHTGAHAPAETVQQMYQGILPANQPSDVSRVTPEGLNVRSVPTYGVDPYTGNPVIVARGAAPSVPGPSGSTLSNKSQAQLSPGTALAFAGNGSQAPAALQAINQAAPPSVSRALLRGGLVGANSPLFLRGDPGQVDYSIVNGGDNGLYGRPAQGFALLPQAPPSIGGSSVARALAQPPVPAPNVTSNINNFLQAQGQNTNGMTAGEQANALKAAIGSHSRGSFGV